MIKHPKLPDRWDVDVDLLAVGSSSGGLTAAIMAHDLGNLNQRNHRSTSR